MQKIPSSGTDMSTLCFRIPGGTTRVYGFSPFEIVFGRTVRQPMRILRHLWTHEDDDTDVRTTYQYVLELKERLEHTTQIAREELRKAQQYQKRHYNLRARQRKFETGGMVLVLLPMETNKLLMHCKGPYSVEERIGSNDYRINVKGKVKTYHVNLLKRYHMQSEKLMPKADDNVRGPLLETVCSAIVEDANGTQEAAGNDGLLKLGSYLSTESFEDVKYGDGLIKEQMVEVVGLFRDFAGVFTDLPGTTTLVSHHIRLMTVVPVSSKPYVVPFSVRKSLQTDIHKMIKMKVIRPSESPYASPVVVVRKRDGTNRICVDYHRLNRITIPDPDPITPMVELVQNLENGRFFTKLDLSKGYWQIPVAEEDISKTASFTPDGCCEVLKMPFAMINSSATLFRAMRKLFQGMEKVESYVDDTIVHTLTWQDHVIVIREVLERILRAGLTVRPSKCLIGAEALDFIGHHIGKDMIEPNEENISKVRSAPRTTTKKELRAFIGLTGFYRDFIPNLSAVAVPLTDLTKKGQPNKIEWEKPQERAYTSLKHAVTSRPVLHLTDHDKPYTLFVDASEVGVGAVLLQVHDGKLLPVGYGSKKLTGAERKYSAIERECLAVVWAVKNIYVTCMVASSLSRPTINLYSI